MCERETYYFVRLQRLNNDFLKVPICDADQIESLLNPIHSGSH